MSESKPNTNGMIGALMDKSIPREITGNLSGKIGSDEAINALNTKTKAVPDLERYDLVGEYDCHIAEQSDGDYVLYSDYQALSEKCAELEAENAAWKLKNDTLKWPEVESKIASLSAEVIELKGQTSDTMFIRMDAYKRLKNEFNDMKKDIVDIIENSGVEEIYNWGAPLRKIRERIKNAN